MFSALRSAGRLASSSLLHNAATRQAIPQGVAIFSPAVTSQATQCALKAARSFRSAQTNTTRTLLTYSRDQVSNLATQASKRVQYARNYCSSAAESSGFMSPFVAWMKANPVTFAMIVTVVRTAPCDLLAQFYFEGKSELDWRRFMAFNLFGAIYVGWFQYYFYTLFLNASLINMFGITGKFPVAASIALLDQIAHSPFLYFPSFCLMMKVMEGGNNILADTYTKWSTEVVGVVQASMALWFPAQLINFYFMPPFLVVPFINLVGACWVVWLSLQQGKGKEETEATA